MNFKFSSVKLRVYSKLSVKTAKLCGLFFMVFLLFMPSSSLFAQSASRQPADPYTMKIAVIGPGDELYFWWGHIGLMLEDSDSGLTRFYDWGVFSFDNENFFVNFALGRLLYSCMVTNAEWNLNTYKNTNRDITLYTLDLPLDKKLEIIRFAENNVLPENRDYFYHHFRDNCATRIVEILDMAVDGQLRAEFGDAPGRYTLRQHVRRHTWFSPFFDWMLNFLMGQGIDVPITVWDEMFLPSEIAMRISDFRYTDSGGNVRPLVSAVETLNTSVGRPAVLDVPRNPWPEALLVSLLLSQILVALYLLCRERKVFEIIIGIVQSLLGLFFGISGSVLFFMTFFTDHDYTYHNINILFINPLFLAAIPLGLIFAFTADENRRSICGRILKFFWVYVFLGALLTIVIKLFPAFYQQNQVTQALVMPVALTLAFIMHRVGRINNTQ